VSAAPRWADLWQLDPGVTFLNHGSFGACPRAVLLAQQQIRDRMEREPVRFFVRGLESELDSARGELAAFLGADSEALAFVPNATTGVNTVLSSLRFRAGDELLTTNHAYNACRNALDFVAAKTGAQVTVAEVPFPIRAPDEALEQVMAKVTSRTRLALLDHVTSPTALVLPLARIVAALNERGVDALVDGAHGPGMLPLDLRSIGAAYYTGNCHKWICAPKGAGFLYVREDRRGDIRPLSISHGMNATRKDRSRFRLEFDWTGTDDFSPFLCIPVAIRFLAGLLPGGWPALIAHNHQLAIAARNVLCGSLGISPPAPDEMLGSMAALPIGDGSREPPISALYNDPLQVALFEQFAVEVPIVPWPRPPKRLIRVSAQIYNDLSDYHRLAAAVREMMPPT